MILLIKLSIITSLLVLGVTILTQEGMGLHKVRLWAESKKMVILEPLVICHWCMPSIYSGISYIFAYNIGVLTELSFSLVWLYPLVVSFSSITCGLIWSLYLLIDNAREYYQNKNSNGSE